MDLRCPVGVHDLVYQHASAPSCGGGSPSIPRASCGTRRWRRRHPFGAASQIPGLVRDSPIPPASAAHSPVSLRLLVGNRLSRRPSGFSRPRSTAAALYRSSQRLRIFRPCPSFRPPAHNMPRSFPRANRDRNRIPDRIQTACSDASCGFPAPRNTAAALNGVHMVAAVATVAPLSGMSCSASRSACTTASRSGDRTAAVAHWPACYVPAAACARSHNSFGTITGTLIFWPF